MRVFFFIFILLFSISMLGFSKQKARVVVIDTGLDINDERFKGLLCPEIGKDYTGDGLNDNMGHGTHIVGLIKKYAKNANYCLIILKYYNSELDSSKKASNSLISLYNDLPSFNADVVNYSGGGPDFIEIESIVGKQLNNTKFFVAAGNQNQNIDIEHYYPASLGFPNVIPVGALNGNEKADFSSWGINVIWEQGVNILSTYPFKIYSSGAAYMSGTSQATAITTGKFLHEHY
jgi:subtilisin family serine protease